MSNGEGDDVAAFEDRLDAAEEALAAAETEADLDDVAATLDDIGSDLEDADLPEPEDDDEEAPGEALEAALSDLRDDLEEARGPYAEDVVSALEDAAETIPGTNWTERGTGEMAAAVREFLASGAVEPYAGDAPDGDDPEALADAVAATADAVGDAGLDADDDAEEIDALLSAAGDLDDGLDAAEEWDDLTVREMLEADGFYDVLDHRKDWPPEWAAVKAYEKRGEAEPILLALERLESNFMEDHCLDALARLGDEAALEPMLERAEKREAAAVEVLGKIGDEAAVETLLEYVDLEGDPQLQGATLRALGEIGSEEATGPVADQLAADAEETRVRAARALGLIGDTRAVEPLSDVLGDDDADRVRAAAAWALVQIGTERALEAAAEYADDRAYLVQAEAEKAAGAVG